MEKKQDIQKIFSVGSVEDVKPLRKDSPDVVAEFSIGETVKAQRPVVTEFIQTYLVYEVGEVESGTADKFKQILVNRICQILKGFGWAGYKVVSVNVSIPDVPTDRNIHP